MMTVGLVVGKSESGRGLPLPSASRMFTIRVGEEGAPSRGPPPRGRRSAPFLSDRGRRAFAVRGAGSCRVSGSSLRRWPHRGVAEHVVRREGGTRVLGRSRSRSCGEDGGEDLPVRFGAAAVRRCGVGGQVAAVVGAEVVVAIGEASPCRSGCLRRRDRQCHLRPGPSALWL
jgi:hypothetical protein